MVNRGGILCLDAPRQDAPALAARAAIQALVVVMVVVVVVVVVVAGYVFTPKVPYGR